MSGSMRTVGWLCLALVACGRDAGDAGAPGDAGDAVDASRDAPADGAPFEQDAAGGDARSGDAAPSVRDAEAGALDDSDGDGVPDDRDLCPRARDPLQRDADADGLGDACDVGDSDGDGERDVDDVCPAVAGAIHDTDADGLGDACDVCPRDADPSQADADGDGIGDRCEIPGDGDADGAPDPRDNCPEVANGAQGDGDMDGVGDACDGCPDDPDPAQADTDGDGLGDGCDACPDTPDVAGNHVDRDGDGRATCAGDCDDANPGRAGGLAEICDGTDNDCDLGIDEGFGGEDLCGGGDEDCDGRFDEDEGDGDGCLGGPDAPAPSCRALLEQHPGTPDGVYWLAAPGGAPFRAACDMTTGGGGWTLIARYRFADGPDVFPDRSVQRGHTWQSAVGSVDDGSFELDARVLVSLAAPYRLGLDSEVAVRSGPRVEIGRGFRAFVPPQVHAVHVLVGEVLEMAGEAMVLKSPCFSGCCGSHTDAWDVPVLVAHLALANADVAGADQNAPAVGWVDHFCDEDGFDTTPAWFMELGGREDEAQRFDADLVFMFR